MKTCIGLIFTLLWLLGLSFPKCLLLWDGLLQLRQKTRAPINHFLNKSGQFWNISNNVSVSPLNFSILYVLIWAGRPQTGGMQTVSEENPTKYEGITRRYILPSPPPPPLHTHIHTQNTPTHAQKGPNRLFRYPYLKHIFSQEYLVFSSIFVPFSWTIKACKKSKKAVKEKGKFVILLKY